MTDEKSEATLKGDSTWAGSGAYRIGANDVLDVSVFARQGADARITVRPDGRVSIPSAGEIAVAGLTVAEMESLLTERYSVFYRDPKVSVNVSQFAPDQVYVVGEIALPGAYPVTRGMTVVQAISRAGGPTNRANLHSVALLRRESPATARAIRLDVKDFLSAREGVTDPYVTGFDIVYVPRTFLASMELVLSQILGPSVTGATLYLRGWEAFHTNRVYQATRPETTPQ